jgi:hypothetical protein
MRSAVSKMNERKGTMYRGFKFTVLMLALSVLAPLAMAEEARGGATIDVVLLVDKSLSMRPAIAPLKKYVAGEVIGPLLVPGDRLIIETFYGKTDRLFAGTIRSEEDKARVVRSLNAIVADGRFTDIGAALDRAQADLAELGEPDKPKYVLLLTDERQEAPAGTKYYAADFKLRHPALQYVKRVDLGSFRAITVGFGVSERVEAQAGKVMQLLAEIPKRDGSKYPALPAGSDGGLDSGREGAAATAADRPAVGAKNADSRSKALVLSGSSVLFLIILAIIVIAVVRSKNRRKNDEGRHDP